MYKLAINTVSNTDNDLSWLTSWLSTMTFQIGNYFIDIYLDLKYYLYPIQINDDLECSYCLTKVVICSSRTSHEVHVINYNNIDLQKSSCHITCDEIQQKVKQQLTSDWIIYIFYMYQNCEYIIPYRYRDGGYIEMPLYHIDDLNTSMKIEYLQIETEHLSSNDSSDLMELISKYSGPKGNFYCDTRYLFSPDMIRDFCSGVNPIDYEQNTIMFDHTDVLKLTTITDSHLSFGASQLISIESLF
jgi:hypothetical protein